MYAFKIYVASPSGGTGALVGGLNRAFGRVLDDGEFSIEVIHVLETPDKAVADGILATPTIVRETPGPEARVTGNCSDMAIVLVRLGLSWRPEHCFNT